ncbi:MAG: polyphosphate kinase 2, partial [Alphaproteobacteria bacterium]|nr:polyphosphate kinase 2 [Alphaproteobacteria bacterium]
QRKRLKARREDPLKQWKTSPIDSSALEHWAAYSHARNDMLQLTHTPESPWTIVRADRKRLARLAVIADFLSRLDYDGKNPAVVKPDPAMIFQFDASFLDNGVLAK